MLRLLSALFVALTVAPAALAAPQRTSLPDIEDEVMCPTCGVPLEHAFSPQAERERDFIRREVATGRTKAQIKQDLVDEFGRDVLATPRSKGFDLAAYVVPATVIAAALVLLGFAFLRWRGRKETDPEPPAVIPPADAARLEHDISRYDL